MTDLWTLCPHLSTEAHWWPAPLDQNENCHGGHRATVEEVFTWLEAQAEAEQIRRAAREMLGVSNG